MTIKTIFFDLDATLYPETVGLWTAIRGRIDEFMHLRLGIPREDIPQIRQEYYQHHGTTLRGLQANYNIDPHDYLTYVHDLPLVEYLKPDPDLRSLLLSLQHHLWIFTNADVDHALRVMKILEIRDCFDGIIDVWILEPYCKPQIEAYHIAMDHAGEPDPDQCVLLDDSTRNLAPAKKLGFFTILVGKDGSHPAAHRSLLNLHNLPDVAPQLWVLNKTS
jgi:pyrimidine 5'-nucleotidase